MNNSLTLVAISDTHGQHRQVSLPDGDLLIHAGDITHFGGWATLVDFADWLATQPHAHKIVIAGNHDHDLERRPERTRSLLAEAGAIYLQDELVVVEGLRIYGSPWQPTFCNMAFNLDRGEPIRARWDLIPAELDVLVTHGPPMGLGDETVDGRHVGCEDLRDAIEARRPAVHIAGHIHEARGVAWGDPTVFVNASICTLDYAPDHAPIVLELCRQPGSRVLRASLD